MTTAEELGFTKPTGTDLVSNGDDAISNNADKSAAMYDVLRNFTESTNWQKGELVLNSSLDDLFTPGLHYTRTAQASASITGKPGDSTFNNPFKILVEPISTTNGIYKQTIEAKIIGSTKTVTMFRTSLSNSYINPWEVVGGDLAWDKGLMASGDNANTFLSSGTRYADTAAVSGSIVNKPAWFDSNPFSVETVIISSSSGIRLQRAVQKISGNPTTRKAERVSLSGNFLEWQNPDAGLPAPRDAGMITIIGDSQSERSATSWDQAVIGALNGTTVINHARSGDESNTVLMREGILELVCHVEGGSIPSSGSVNLTTNMVVQARENRLLIGGTLNGVGGTLSFVSGDTWTFTRSATGTAVSVPSWTVFKSSWGQGGSAATAAHALIAWFGGNDFNYHFAGQERSVAEHIIGNYRRFIEYCHANNYRPIIAGVTNRLAAGAGTAGFAEVQQVNSECRRMFPDIFLEVQAYYSEHAIYDAGLTPTQADLDAIEAGAIPPQLFLADGVHLIPAAHAAIGEHWIAPWLAAKGYGRTTLSLEPLPTLNPKDN